MRRHRRFDTPASTGCALNSSCMHVGADDLATVLRERNRLREQVTRLERDNKEMLRRVEQGGQVCWCAPHKQLECVKGI